MASTGLLERAKEIIRKASSAEKLDGGFTKTDHEDILAHIEKIASQNRIQVSPSLFKLKPKHKGYGLALVINIGALVFIVLGIFLMYSLFSTRESEVVHQSTSLKSTEGKLLEQIKQQSEQELAEKDRLLADIETKLSEVQKEKNVLAGNLEDRLKQRESALKQELDEILEAERKKLRSQGLSDSEVEKRIKDIEKKKNEEYSAQINSFKTQLTAEKEKAEKNLAALESQFASQISKVNTDREVLLAESKKKEEALRAELAKELQTKQAASSEIQEKAKQAQEQLEKLNQSREQERTIDNQLVGFYLSLKNQLDNKKWSEALSTLSTLRAMLKAPVFSSNDALIQKRDKELFTIKAFELYIEKELASASTSEILKNADIFSKAQDLLKQAQNETKLGNTANANVTWDSLLKILPGASEALVYKTEQNSKNFQTKLSEIQNQYQTQILETQKKNDALLQQTIVDAETASRSAQAKIDDLQNKILDALAQGELDKKRISNLESTLTITEKEKLNLENQVKTLNSLAASIEAKGTALVLQTSEELNSALLEAKTGLEQNKTKIQNLTDQITQLSTELENNKVSSARYEALTLAYNRYLEQKTTDLASSRLSLDNFLNLGVVSQTLPNLASTIRSFDLALESSGRQNALLELTDLLYVIANQKDKALREKLIDAEISKTSDAVQKELWTNILGILR